MDLRGYRKQKTFSLPNQDWADWLSNDGPSPAAKEELRRQRVKQAGIYTPRGFNSQPMFSPAEVAEAEVKSVVINLHLPKLSNLTPTAANLDKLKKVKLSRRRVGIAVALVLVLFLIQLNPAPAPKTQTNTDSAAVVQAAQSSRPSNAINTAKLATTSTSPSITQPNNSVTASAIGGSSDQSKPTFTPVVPASQPELKKPTFGRTFYSSDTNVYTIMDGFGGGPVTINETSAPAGSSAQTVAQANAKQISEPQIIKLASGDAYLTAPTSSGQQTAVLAVGNVIIFVNSKIAHSVSDWQTYLKNLN